MKRITAFLSIIILLTQVSCEKIIMSNEGQESERIENYEYFSKLTFYDIFEAELRTDTAFSIKLISHEKYIENIIITIDSGEISFRDENFARWMPDYPRPRVYLSFPRLDNKILVNSPVKLTSADTLKTDRLTLVLLGKTGEYDLTMNVGYFQVVTGSDNFGHYYFRGYAKTTNIWPRGSCQIDASSLSSQECNVYNNSIGDCFINVSHKIKARLNTAGNVYYSGNPSEIIINEESGSGKLIRTDI